MSKVFNPTTQGWELPPIDQAVAAWKAGDIVWSAELGGLGPGYEQAIQVLLWEFMAAWGNRNLPEPEGENYPPEFVKAFDEVVHELSPTCGGFSGAQAGAAKGTAWNFLKYGYRHMMEKLPKDRHIMVSRRFPHAPEKPVVYNVIDRPIMVVTKWTEDPAGGPATPRQTISIAPGEGAELWLLGLSLEKPRKEGA